MEIYPFLTRWVTGSDLLGKKTPPSTILVVKYGALQLTVRTWKDDFLPQKGSRIVFPSHPFSPFIVPSLSQTNPLTIPEQIPE